MTYKIGIIGTGFVGSAISSGFDLLMPNKTDIREYDKFKDTENLDSVVDNSDILFICVPTPVDDEGYCDTSIVFSVAKEINKIATTRKTIVIKSTVEPGTTEELASCYRNHNWIFNPEFLTEAKFIEDFLEQDRIILGVAPGSKSDLVKDLYGDFIRQQKVPGKIFEVDSKAAEMVKYVNNCFLATKVSFFNEIYDICAATKIDFETVRKMVCLDKRIGPSHTKVPGPDGNRGFGGKCLCPSTNIETLESGNTTLSHTQLGHHVFDGKEYTKITKLGYRIVDEYVSIDCRGRLLEGSKDHIQLVDKNGSLTEVYLENVKKGDKLFIPKTKLPSDYLKVELGSKPNGYVNWWLERFVWKSKEFSRLVGLYLSEGCSAKYKRKNRNNSYLNYIIWSFGAHEEEFADEIVETLTNLGLNPYKKFQTSIGTFGVSNCWIVRCQSVGLKTLFDKLGLGTNAGNKNCPTLPAELAKHVIGAWLDGDGNIYNGTVSGYSKSTNLINAIDKMLLGLGICASIKHKGHTICISQRKDVERIVQWTKRLKIKEDTYLTERYNKSPNLWDKESGWLATVKSTKIINKPKTVISIETESKKYVANGILTHNCFPKDIQALTAYAYDYGVHPMILEMVWLKNLNVREKQDWLEIKGATTQNLHKKKE